MHQCWRRRMLVLRVIRAPTFAFRRPIIKQSAIDQNTNWRMSLPGQSAAGRSRCSTSHFDCEGKACLLMRNRCNGIIDCSDGSDEENCLPWKSYCPTNYMYCADEGKCMMMYVLGNKMKFCFLFFLKIRVYWKIFPCQQMCKENFTGSFHVSRQGTDYLIRWSMAGEMKNRDYSIVYGLSTHCI